MGGDPVSSSGIGDNETLMWLISLYSLKVLLARDCVFTSQLVGVVVLLASYNSSKCSVVGVPQEIVVDLHLACFVVLLT